MNHCDKVYMQHASVVITRTAIYIRACVHNNAELVRILTNKQTKNQPNSHLLERQKRDVLPEVLCFVVTSNGLRGRTWIFMLERKLRSLSYWWWVHRDIREHVFCQDASFYTLLGKELTGGKQPWTKKKCQTKVLFLRSV